MTDAVGGFSQRIGELKPGIRVLGEGPFGTFTADARRRDKVLLIAGGIGITPIRALMEDMDPGSVVIYHVVRHDDVVLRNELASLAQARRIGLHIVVGDHATLEGSRLLMPAHLHQLVPDIAERDVYVGGPPAMTDVLERNVRHAGVPRRFIHTERFAL
jgi:ferredoxin-NADP reductase